MHNWLGVLERRRVRRSLVLSATGLAWVGSGCGSEHGPSAAEHWPADAGMEVAPDSSARACVPSPRTSEDLTPRIDLIAQVGAAASTALSVELSPSPPLPWIAAISVCRWSNAKSDFAGSTPRT